MNDMFFRILCLFLVFLSACAVNPVTGKSELTLISQTQELALGQNQYAPSRQSQGGDYVADPPLVTYVQGVGQRLAQVSDRKLPYEFAIINSSVPNAWALPGGKIAVNRGLLVELNSEAELAAVLGHEIVHAAARHSAQGMERGLLLQGATIAAGAALKNSAYADYSDLALKGAGLAANLVHQKYGRDAEREADLYGMTYMKRAGYDPQAAVSLQETFVRLNQSRTSNWLTGLFASHPPSQERVENNQKQVILLGAGGERGVEPYQKALAHLQAASPAYEAYDEGVEALKAGHADEARQLAQKAIKIEPKEGLFYALLGDSEAARGADKAALVRYDQAVQANPGFFLFHEKRGMFRQKNGDLAGARADLHKATELLPTAKSFLALGLMAEQSGDLEGAIGYFQEAAHARSEAGQRAAHSLVKLDLSRRPNHYLTSRIIQDRQGDLHLQISNPTTLPVQHLRVVLFFTNRQNKQEEIAFNYSDPLSPGQSITLPTGLNSQHDRLIGARNVRSQIEQAQVVTP